MVEKTQEMRKIEQFAQEHNVPIIMAESVEWLGTFLCDKKVHTILEIGSAIGYSALSFHHVTGATVIGVERDEQRYDEAIKNIALQQKQESIKISLDDANSEAFFETAKQHAPYDLLFIDATKRENKLFFEKFSPLVKPGGYIITDNLAFHGLASTEEEIMKLHRRIRPLVRAIIEYQDWLQTLEGYETTFVEVGDKLAITQKK